MHLHTLRFELVRNKEDQDVLSVTSQKGQDDPYQIIFEGLNLQTLQSFLNKIQKAKRLAGLE